MLKLRHSKHNRSFQGVIVLGKKPSGSDWLYDSRADRSYELWSHPGSCQNE